MQWLTDRENVEISSHEDMERFYLQSSNKERLCEEWLKYNKDYLSSRDFKKYGDYIEGDAYEDLLEKNGYYDDWN